jgi:transcription elongation factor Elf1
MEEFRLISRGNICSRCNEEFQAAAAVDQHVALHHSVCGLCDSEFNDTDDLRDHTHSIH